MEMEHGLETQLSSMEVCPNKNTSCNKNKKGNFGDFINIFEGLLHPFNIQRLFKIVSFGWNFNSQSVHFLVLLPKAKLLSMFSSTP